MLSLITAGKAAAVHCTLQSACQAPCTKSFSAMSMLLASSGVFMGQDETLPLLRNSLVTQGAGVKLCSPAHKVCITTAHVLQAAFLQRSCGCITEHCCRSQWRLSSRQQCAAYVLIQRRSCSLLEHASWCSNLGKLPYSRSSYLYMQYFVWAQA